MDAASVPLWVQAAGSIAGTGLVAVWVAWSERRKERKAPLPPVGDAQVVAATFTGTRELQDVVVALCNLDGTMRSVHETLGRVEAIMTKTHQQMHDDFIVRVAKGGGS
jgi:hypothetical protein